MGTTTTLSTCGCIHLDTYVDAILASIQRPGSLAPRDDPERLARPYRGVLKSHSTSADANRHDTGRRYAFALVSSIGNAFGLVVVLNSIIVGTDTRRASSTRRGVDIPGVLKTFRIVG
ncbi:hypothetical protein GW17_00032791 [Ensete ventricosum]|nr:hypothetical protein GW17_00032791 [Ensete ventricosum]